MNPNVGTEAEQRSPVLHQAQGVTDSERYLKELCQHSILSLWSFAGVYRDQGKAGATSDGKEICDLLVAFRDHIIIFSSKACAFPDTGNLDVDWSRWFKRAVLGGAEQVWGAERWIKSYPHRVYLDRACTKRFPFDIPGRDRVHFHRIVVAHGAAERCKEEIGGSGSLVLKPDIIGKSHELPRSSGGMPFTIGQLDPSRGYVHVFDDISLNIVMGTLDTISDFIAYLSKKEQFISEGRLFAAEGEENLLAHYLSDINSKGEHDFMMPDTADLLLVPDGRWYNFSRSPQRQAQLLANEVSYAWDGLIETFNKNIIGGTLQYTTHPGFNDQDKLLSWLAREPRTRRRFLAERLLDLIAKTPANQKATRVILSTTEGEPYYIFLVLPTLHARSYEEYRQVRFQLLSDYCLVLRMKYPQAQDIVGIATEAGRREEGSEDLVYFDGRIWSDEDQREAEQVQKDLGLLQETGPLYHAKIRDYPDISDFLGPAALQPLPGTRHALAHESRLPPNPRNKPCPCKSGKKYKRCCGK